jgi:hypothetical protein
MTLQHPMNFLKVGEIVSMKAIVIVKKKKKVMETTIFSVKMRSSGNASQNMTLWCVDKGYLGNNRCKQRLSKDIDPSEGAPLPSNLINQRGD